MTRPLLLLVTTRTYRAGAFLRAAERLGQPLLIGTNDALAWPEGQRLGALDFSHPETAGQAITQNLKEPPCAVLSAEDEGVQAAAAASARLGLIHNPPDAVALTRDKAALRQRLHERAPHLNPAFWVLPLDGDPEELASLVTYPCVVKPRHLSGSRAVIRADHPAEFVAAFRRTARIIRSADPSGESAASATLLVEAYLPGSEHALEGLLTDGDLRQLALFDKPDPLEGPHFEETLYVTPSRLSLKHQDAIFHAVAEAVGALGLTHGPVHAEVRVDGGRVWILEIAARSIGGLCSRALRFVGGRSLEEILLAHAVGLPLGNLEPESPSRGVMMIPIPRAGVLERVVGLEEARSTHLVEDLVLTMHPGQTIVPLPEGAAYLGFIFARGETPAEVEQALRNAHTCLSIEVGG